MTQELITYTILIATACFIIFKLFHRKSVQKKDGCGGCESSCSGCDLTQIKHQIGITRKNKS